MHSKQFFWTQMENNFSLIFKRRLHLRRWGEKKESFYGATSIGKKNILQWRRLKKVAWILVFIPGNLRTQHWTRELWRKCIHTRSTYTQQPAKGTIRGSFTHFGTHVIKIDWLPPIIQLVFRPILITWHSSVIAGLPMGDQITKIKRSGVDPIIPPLRSLTRLAGARCVRPMPIPDKRYAPMFFKHTWTSEFYLRIKHELHTAFLRTRFVRRPEIAGRK